jgi:hypothetical protein
MWGAAVALWMMACVAPAMAQPLVDADFGSEYASADVRYVARWVLSSADHGALPFAIVDKRDARIYVFGQSGRLFGASSALLGQMRGDDSAPEVGEHAQAGSVPLDERTTPSGRFVSEPGLNLAGEHVVWVDYASALAIHRLRPGASRPARIARLASSTPDDKRVSLGCVVVPPAFYTGVIEPLLGHTRAVIYVLPEGRSVREVYNAL